MRELPEEKLVRYKGALEKAKTMVARKEGELGSLEESMASEFEVASVGEADRKLRQLRKKLGVYDAERDEKIKEIDRDYAF